jgi:hypothetical protein
LNNLQVMKMPSTYVSLLLLCGFAYVYIFTQKQAGQPPNPAPHAPVIKEKRPVVKRFSPAKAAIVYLNKKHVDGKKEEQTAQPETGFSFFKDVMADIAPALRYLK